MLTVQIHRQRHEVVSMTVLCDQCHQPFAAPDDTVWFVWAEPAVRPTEEITTVPVAQVHADCVNQWLYDEVRKGPGKRLFGGCRACDAGKETVTFSMFNPDALNAP